MKLLIVKLSSIGDIVHAMPALAFLRRELPDADIGWAVGTRYAEILRGNEMIDHLVELDARSLRGGKISVSEISGAGSQFTTLRKHKFDVALDLQGLLKSATIARYSGAKTRWGFSRSDLREPASRVFYTDTLNVEPKTHVIRKNISLAAKAFGFDPSEAAIEFPIFTDKDNKDEAEAIAEKAGSEFVVLNPAGGWVTKLWPAENYAKLADAIHSEHGLSTVVSVGPNDDSLAEKIRSNIKGENVIFAKPSLKGFYELAKLARLYVGGDTGPTHIAVAAGTPVVGIFGPTEWWRNGSTSPSDICVERVDIGCRVDCHRRTCSNWICMDIDVGTVFQAIKHRLAN